MLVVPVTRTNQGGREEKCVLLRRREGGRRESENMGEGLESQRKPFSFVPYCNRCVVVQVGAAGGFCLRAACELRCRCSRRLACAAFYEFYGQTSEENEHSKISTTHFWLDAFEPPIWRGRRYEYSLCVKPGIRNSETT